ncbi:hypothetical protein Tco_1363072 [Tanacetum coccineum]
MGDPNITMEEYIRLEEEKAHRHGKVYNWETATYGKIWDNEDFHDLGSVETKFPAIVFNDTLTSEATLSCEPTELVKEISTNIGGEFTNLEILKCWSLETSRRTIRQFIKKIRRIRAALTKDPKGLKVIRPYPAETHYARIGRLLFVNILEDIKRGTPTP